MHRQLRLARRVLLTCLVASGVAAGSVAGAVPAFAASRPVVTGLSRHSGPYWGATPITIHGQNLDGAQRVLFGRRAGFALHVVSSTTLTVLDPYHRYGTVDVRVVGADGRSARRPADRFSFVHPTMDSPIMGGLTARQEQRVSAHVRAAHHGVRIAPRAGHWTPAMGVTAMRRARSWLGLPYSWAGGSLGGPTYGVCAHNGGDLDCHVVGFDCSGLAMFSWSPYESLAHYAATQHAEAGRFHPTIGELMPGDLVFFSGYIANGIGHVAVYAGHGTVYQAAQSGTTVTRSRLVDVIAESGVYRGATRPMSTGRQGPAPRIASVTAEVPARGGYVRITGRHLASTTSVYVGGARVYSFAQRTHTHLVVKVPPHPNGQVRLAVADAWGTATRPLTYVGAPGITALTPASGSTAGGTAVTISGSALAPVRQVLLGGSPQPFTLVGPHRIAFTTPAHAAGPVPVTLVSRFGTSAPATFSFVAPSARDAGPPRRHATRPPGAHRHRRPFLDRIGDRWYLVGRLARGAGPSHR